MVNYLVFSINGIHVDVLMLLLYTCNFELQGTKIPLIRSLLSVKSRKDE